MTFELVHVYMTVTDHVTFALCVGAWLAKKRIPPKKWPTPPTIIDPPVKWTCTPPKQYYMYPKMKWTLMKDSPVNEMDTPPRRKDYPQDTPPRTILYTLHNYDTNIPP